MEGEAAPNDPRAAVQPSNSRRAVKEGTEELAGTGEIVTDADHAAIVTTVKAKDGLMWSVVRAYHLTTNTFTRGDPAERSVS